MNGLDPNTIAKLLGKATQKQHGDIERRITECMELANKHSPKNYRNPDDVYDRPTVRFDLRGTTAGEAWGSKDIRLNVELLHQNYDEMLTQVLPHEIAHCLVYQRWHNDAKSHGWQWKDMMRTFGLPPLRTHAMPVKPARHHPRPHRYACTNCNRDYWVTNNLHSKMQVRQRYCRACKSPLYYVESEVL